MDERKLRYFLAVVSEGTVTRAAAALRVAQPSVSQSLRALESELGVTLFDRVGRGLRLSSTGREFLVHARQVVRAIDEARNAVASVHELRAGTLELAALATLAVDPMALLIGRFRKRHPEVQVRIRAPDSAHTVSSLLRDGSCELGATVLPSPASGLLARSLGEQELLFVLPPTGASNRSGPIRARELAGTPFVISPVGTSTRSLLEEALAAAAVTVRIAVEVSAREAIVPLVLAGAGAALLPRPLADEARRRGAVIRPAAPPITRPIGLLHRDAKLSPAAQAFLALAASRR
ncbi:MAG: LysR family transcriptional regulator [Solirubrobacteraceae bacterium]